MALCITQAALQDVARQYSISAMPTFLAFLDGTPAGKVVGAELAKIEDLIKQCACSKGSVGVYA